MNREQTKAAAEIMIQFANDPNAELQCRECGERDDKWGNCKTCPLWNWADFEYRIKPKPITVWAVVRGDKVMYIADTEQSAKNTAEAWPNLEHTRVAKFVEEQQC